MICPSILSADFSQLKEILPRMEQCGIQVVHFDVMDNHFVPNLTFGPKFIADLRRYSKMTFDVHLMISQPEKTLDQYLDAGADYLTVHYEATSLFELKNMSQKVRSAGKKFGVSIKPKTPVSVYEDILELMDL
ncbi:MAG: ribulose-phosphate 3-epimerase, partial [Spirochaetae bacterium HGW-Spirochaetae-6]